MNAECRLVAYGTLASGRPNHHQLDGLNGRWLQDGYAAHWSSRAEAQRWAIRR